LNRRNGKATSLDEGGVDFADLTAQQLERPRIGAERGNREPEKMLGGVDAENLDRSARVLREARSFYLEHFRALRQFLHRKRRRGFLKGRNRRFGDRLHGFCHSGKSGEIGSKDFVSFPDLLERSAQEGQIETSLDSNGTDRHRRPLRVSPAQTPERSLLWGEAKSFEYVRAHGAGAVSR
jgi:hypothetical protein